MQRGFTLGCSEQPASGEWEVEGKLAAAGWERRNGMEGYQRITAEIKEPETPAILCLRPRSFSVSSLATHVATHRGVTLGSW